MPLIFTDIVNFCNSQWPHSTSRNNFTCAHKHPLRHLVDIPFCRPQTAPQIFLAGGEFWYLVSWIYPFIPLELADIGDVSRIAKRWWVGVGPFQLKRFLCRKNIYLHTSLNAIISQSHQAVSFFHIFAHCFLHQSNIEFFSIGPWCFCFQQTEWGSHVHHELP